MTKVKICGLTNKEDALKACEYGADFVGFVFVENTPRYVEKNIVERISGSLPEVVVKVGLFRGHDIVDVKETATGCGLDHVQLHGDESPEYCAELKEICAEAGFPVKVIKTFKVKDYILGNVPGAYSAVDYYLFDTYDPILGGGTGEKFDWEVLRRFKGDKPVFIAGGLTPENVMYAVEIISPFGVDVSSGVESSLGKKDELKLKEFIVNAKKIQ